MTNYIELDAAEIRGMLATSEWRKAFLIARNVENRGKGRPAKMAERPISKTSADEFAGLVGVQGWSRKVVLRHLESWDKAAADGLVPHAADLVPGQELDGELPDPALWSDYYPPGDTNLLRASEDTRAEFEQAAQDTGTTATTVARFVASPQGIQGAIMASPKAREAAEVAIRTVREREGVDVVAETAREIKANPAAMRAAIMESPDVASAALHAVQDAAEQSAGKAPRPNPDSVESQRLWDLSKVLRRTSASVTEAARLLLDVPLAGETDVVHRGIANLVDTIKDKVDLMHAHVHEGMEFDAQLQTLLDSER